MSKEIKIINNSQQTVELGFQKYTLKITRDKNEKALFEIWLMGKRLKIWNVEGEIAARLLGGLTPELAKHILTDIMLKTAKVEGNA